MATVDESFDYIRRIIPATETMFVATPGVTPPATFLLDSVSATSAVAYSTRKLRAAYAGNALQIQRSSDNAKQDIGFDGSGNLDTASLLSFIGANSGTISIWYDQSGNGTYGANATDFGDNTGAILVSSGTLQTVNGHAAGVMATNTNANKFSPPTVAIPQPDSLAVVVQITTAGNSLSIMDDIGNTPTLGRQLFRVGLTRFEYFAGTDQQGGTPDTNLHGQIMIFNGVSSILYQDNTSVLSGDAGTQATEGPVGNGVGCGIGLADAINGILPEFIIFTSALGAPDRATIRTNWTTYWGTP